MKKLLLILGILLITSPAYAVTYYAVNAGGNWSNANTWSTTAAKDASRTGGGGVPDATIDIIIDDYSGAVTVDAASLAKSLDCTGAVNTLTHNAFTLTVSGSVTLAATKYTAVGAATLAINATGTLTSAGNTLYKLTTSVGEITLGDDLTVSNLVTHTSGTLITGGAADSPARVHNWGLFNSDNSNTRTITLGNSTINVSGVASGTWSMSTVANLTFNANTSTINFTGNSSLTLMYAGAKIYNIVNFTGSGTPILTASGSTFGTLTRTGTAVKTDGFTFSNSFTVTGTLSLAGNSATNRLLVKSITLGTPITITVTGANLTGTTNVDFMDITLADNKVGDTDLTNGGANSIGDAGGNTRTLGTGNLVMTTAVKQYWQNVAGGTWSTTANWTSRVPLPQDDVDLGNTADATPITYNSGVTVTADMPRLGKSISWTGATWSGTATTWTIGNAISIYGSLTLISGMTFAPSGTNIVTFAGRGAYTLTSAGKTFFTGVYLSAPSGSLTLQDAFLHNSGSHGLAVIAGTFNANDKNVTAGFFSSNGSLTRVINMGSGTWTITVYSTTWQITGSNVTVNANTSTIFYSYAGANTHIFSGGTQTYNNITIAPGSGVLTFSGAFTFANMTMASAGTKTVKFTKSTTYTMTGTNFLNGTSGNLVTIDSNDGATAFTLTKASGTVLVDYVSLKNSTVTTATWQAKHSTNVSNNTGWDFLKYAVAAGGNWSATATWWNGVVPTSADDAYLDSVSGNVTVDIASACKNLTCTGYTGILTQGAGLTISGDLTFVSGMTFTPSTYTITMDGNNAILTSAGKTFYDLTLQNNITFADALNVSHLFKCITPSKTLTFASSVTHVLQDIQLDGQASGTKITLAPLTAATTYTWNVTAATQTDVSYVSVSYCDASAGSQIQAANGTNVDNGSNVNWNFVGDTYIIYQNQRLEIWVDGHEVARFKTNGDIDVNGTVNNNAF